MSEVAAQPSAPRVRSAFLDNAKGILVTLVAFAHVMGNLGLGQSAVGAAVYALIYAFHIPAFAFVTGWLSRPDTFSARGVERFLRILALYGAFQVSRVLVANTLSSGHITFERAIVAPQYALWWLVTMLTWQLLLPACAWLMERTRPWIVIAAAVAVALLVGVYDPDGLIFSRLRTLNFLPFFLAGYAGSRYGWRLPRTVWTRAASACVFVGAFLVLLPRDAGRVTRWLFSSMGVERLPTAVPTYLLVRPALWVVSAVLIIAFLQLVPRRKMFFTRLGSTTLSVFVWHSTVLFATSYVGALDRFDGSWVWAFLITGALVAASGFGPLANYTSRFITVSRAPKSGSEGVSA